MRHYCTYFDSNYLLMGLALYHSLREHSREPFTLWVLCFDDNTYEVLEQLALPEMRIISQHEFEAGDDALLQAKQTRSKVEYYWTCTPSLPLYVLENHPEVDVITYLDADLYFFSDPAPIFDEFGENSIMILEHRFPPPLKEKEIYGIYNVSLMVFRRDFHGIKALQWWRKQCNEWCFNRLEDGKFGDQKYLDDWPRRFENVVVLQHKGAGCAPWNLVQYDISKKRHQVFLDGTPLIFYHFHRFRMVTWNIFAPGKKKYTGSVPVNVLKQNHIRDIYHPYASYLQSIGKEMSNGAFCQSFPKISWKKRLRIVLKGKAFLVKPKRISMLISRFTLWLSERENNESGVEDPGNR